MYKDVSPSRRAWIPDESNIEHLFSSSTPLREKNQSIYASAKMNSKNLAAVVTAVQAPIVIEERPIPTPGPGEVLIRNHVIAVNPIDWKRWHWGIMVQSYPCILGLDVAGVVTAVGSGVTEFKPGDRVVGCADGTGSGKNTNAAYQTYTVTRTASTAKIPDATTFLTASTAIVSISTAAIALYDVFGLPYPEITAEKVKVPKNGEGFLVWGGASSVGVMLIQLARLSGFTVFATASERHHDWLRSLGADVVVDYNSDTVVDDLVAAAERAGTPVKLGVDAIAIPETQRPAFEVLAKSGQGVKGVKLAYTLPLPDGFVAPEGVDHAFVQGEDQWGRREDISKWVFHKAFPVWLENGTVVPGPYRIVEGGIRGLQTAMEVLMKGVSGEKLVVEVE